MHSNDDLSTWHEYFIICPYCKTLYQECHEYFDKFYDEETTEIDCDNCNKIFKAELHIKVKYSTYPCEEKNKS